MDTDFYNHLIESRKQGVEAGILLTKIEICKWLLDSQQKNEFKTSTEIAQYILDLKIDQREYEQNEQNEGTTITRTIGQYGTTTTHTIGQSK